MAGVGGWQIYRITPDGNIDMTIDVPVEKPTKPMFGGANRDILFVSSIGFDLTAGTETDQPEAGATGHYRAEYYRTATSSIRWLVWLIRIYARQNIARSAIAPSAI